jgi:hypothetical protein
MALADTKTLRDLSAAHAREVERLTAERDSARRRAEALLARLDAEARPAPPEPGAMCPTCGQRKAEEGVVPFHLILPLSEPLDRTLTDDDRKLMTQLVAGAVMTAMGEALERITHAPRRGIYVPGVPGSPPRRT